MKWWDGTQLTTSLEWKGGDDDDEDEGATRLGGDDDPNDT
jgi:hypothetical protein